jgi:nicotinamidase-related amidase
VIAGMMTHMCVDTTVRAAADLGFQCVLAHDACATRALSFDGAAVTAAQVQTAFLAALNGLFAKVQSTGQLCESL